MNVIRSVYHELEIPLMNIFSKSLSIGIFPDKMKIAKVSPIFKNCRKTIVSNYRQISVLSCFSKILERIMYIRFADDTNLFCSNKKIRPLFLKANLELRKISEWFRANKLSLNEDKSRFTLFLATLFLPLRLPALKINDYEIKRSSSIKFLGILVDEHLSWIDHIDTLENKLSKNLGLLYKAKPFLNTKAMKSLHFLTYGNIAWCSKLMTKLKKNFSKQKQAIKTISMTSLDYKNLKSEEIMDRFGIILIIYKSNIYHTVNLMFRLKSNTIPEAFRTKCQIAQHNYATRYNENNFEEPKITFKATKFAIPSRGHRLWNKHTDRFVKTITSALLFKAKLKEYLVKLRNVTNYF